MVDISKLQIYIVLGKELVKAAHINDTVEGQKTVNVSCRHKDKYLDLLILNNIP